MNLLWSFVRLINMVNYQKYADDDVAIPKGHTILFQISRRIGSSKQITTKKLIASHNSHTGMYHFDNKRFVAMNDMLYYILTI